MTTSHAHALIAALATAGASGVCSAQFIIDTNVTGITGGSSVTNTQYNAINFSLTSSFSNVAVEAALYTVNGAGNGFAYLTTQVGPGTNASHVVATGPAVFVGGGYKTLFSGLDLGPGSYWIVLGSTGPDGAIQLSSTATYTTHPNASVGGMYFSASGIDAGFAPASTFTASGLGNRLFRVTPAPSAAGLLAIAGLAAARRRR